MSDANSAKPKGFKFDYSCDACSLGITVNDVNMMLLNHVGDGDGTVYIHGFDDGDPIDLPDNNQTDLVMVVGTYGEDTPISLGLRDFDIESGSPDVVIVAKQFHIYKVKDSRDFVIRVSKPECVKSLVASGQGHLEFKGFDEVNLACMNIIYKRVMVYTLPGKQKFAGKAIDMQVPHIHPVSMIEGGKRRYYLPFCSDTNSEPLEISRKVYIKLRSVEKDFKEHPDRYRLVYDRKAFDRAYKNCSMHPDEYGSNAMFDFLFWSALELYHLMDKKYRVQMHLFGREEASGEDIGCIRMRRCCFYFINAKRSDVVTAPFEFVRDHIVPELHKKLRTSSACIVLGPYTGKWSFSMNSEARDWMTSTILKEYEAYRKRTAK